MDKYLVIVTAAFLVLLTGRIQATEDPLSWLDSPEAIESMMATALVQEPTVLHLQLGVSKRDPNVDYKQALATGAGEFVMNPKQLTLRAGKPYRLLIENLSDVTHVLSLPQFSATVEHSSTPAFPYSATEIDVAAGETVEWYFVPTRAGTYKMGCAEPAHAKAGMTGTILVN